LVGEQGLRGRLPQSGEYRQMQAGARPAKTYDQRAHSMFPSGSDSTTNGTAQC